MDRLSELPDSLIFHIFWLLPITDVVKTTILSKRWENLWTTTPFLNITDNHISTDNHIFDSDTGKKFANIVHRALLRWDGVKVLKFKVKLDHERSIHEDADLWLRFAKKHEVEELYLLWVNSYIPWSCDDHKSHCVPQYLYSCSSLKVLSIKNCRFRIKGNVQWNHLKSLIIINGLGITGDVINQILCGSPQLEVLTMSVVETGKSLCIRSTSLKQLSIRKHLFYADDASASKTELRIWTPNLETLVIKGLAYSKCLLMNVSSLNRATFGYSGLHHVDEIYCDGFSGGIDDFLSRSHFLGDLFGQILPSIQHVENVTLLPCCLKVLGAMIEGCMNSSSPNVKLLQFRFYYTKVDGVFEIFPLSKKLVVKVRESGKCKDAQGDDPNIYLEFEVNLPTSFVLQLRTVEVILVGEGDNIFPFLEFLLRNASKLEKIVFRVKGFTRLSRPSESLLRASQRLLKMPRLSRTAHFTFYEY